MRININNIWQKTIELLRLSPMSLAGKCRLAFGSAIILVLAMALLLPYVWMGQLTRKSLMDAGKAKTDMLQNRHFQPAAPGKDSLMALKANGEAEKDVSTEIKWVRLNKEQDAVIKLLGEDERRLVKSLRSKKNTDEENLALESGKKKKDIIYARLFKATDNCIRCHNPQGSASAFGHNEPVGVALVNLRSFRGEMQKTQQMNLVWILAAGLIGGTGAIVAFYIIMQKVILSPIRQLRAIANNVAEGNLDVRSAISTGDEYEKLSAAFNHMLDSLQGAQERLRQANKALDAKIVELSERNIELFKANKVKSEFLANMSHEFRTPLNVIIGFADILRDKPELIQKDKGKRYSENIIAAGKNLLNMVNDLLEMAKTEAGKLKVHIDRTSIQQLCRLTLSSFLSITRNKMIKVKMHVEEDIPELMTDAGKVQQILYNFLSNAVKFTAEGGKIEIQAKRLDEKTVRLSVTDTGCGIAEEDREKIFEKFRQVDGSLTRETSGSGLGLSISKELAAMLAGSIGLESEVGKGSTFWLDIPITLSKPQEIVAEKV